MKTYFILDINLQTRKHAPQIQTKKIARTMMPAIASAPSSLALVSTPFPTLLYLSLSMGASKVCYRMQNGNVIYVYSPKKQFNITSYDLATRAISRQKACLISSVVVSFGSSLVNSEVDNV